MTWWFVGSSCSNCGRLWWPFSWTRRTEPPNPQCNLFRSIILATHHLFHVLLQRSMPCEVLQKWKLAPASHVVCNVLSPRRIVCIVFSIHIYTRLHVYIVYRHIYMYICTSYFFFRCKSPPHFSIFPASQGDAMGCGASAHRYQADGSGEVQARSRENDGSLQPRGQEITHIGIKQGKSQVILSDLPIIKSVLMCIVLVGSRMTPVTNQDVHGM